MGIYVYNESVLEHIPRDRFDFPDVVKSLIAADKPVAAYPFDGRWFDIGTFGDFEKAAAEIADHPEAFELA
jgi:NDP-sugar pyrophosphorylase family protein